MYEGKFKEAIDAYNKVFTIEPNAMVALHNKGIALDNLGIHEEAIEYYDRVLALVPNDIAALLNKAVALDNLGRHEKAINVNDRILDMDPNDVSFHEIINAKQLFCDQTHRQKD